MKKSYLFTFIGLVMSSLGFTPLAHGQTFPYSCGFEDDTENAQWTLLNGSSTNQWYIGTAAKNSGEKGLYITHDNGATSEYDKGSSTWVFAYRPIEITEEGGYTVSFDSYVAGERHYDYVRAFLAPSDMTFSVNAASGISTTSLPSNCIALDGGSYISGQSAWETKLSTQNIPAGSYNLVFSWRNDGSGGSAPVAIDNVKISKLSNDPEINVTGSLEFPTAAVGGSSMASLAITNNGGGALTISSITFDNPAFSVAGTPDYSESIAALGGSKTYQIQFSPTSEGETTGTMTIHSNGDDATVSLSGTGYAAIEITDDTPLFEDFNALDESADNFGLLYWAMKPGYATGSSSTSWKVNTSPSYTVDGKSLQAVDAQATATTLLISPMLKYNADRQAKISFYMNRIADSHESKQNEGFKVYVSSDNDIYSYDSDGNIVINDDNTVTTLVEPILRAPRYAGDEVSAAGMYQMEVNIPAEMAGENFYVIFEAIQENGSANYIDNVKIELVPNTPKLGEVIESIDFGLVKAGETVSREFSLSNVGAQPLEVSFSQELADSPFSITPTTGNIAFNEQQTFTVSFQTDEVGAFNDSLFISTNGGNDAIALVAETYPTTAYYESFDASTNMPLEWTVAPNEGESNYTVKSGIGVNNSNAISVSSNSYYSSSIDTLYSPVVSGKVSFDCKKESSYSSSSSSFEAYVVNASGELTSIDLTATTSWSTITIDNVPEGSRIAFLMNSAYLDNFIAFSHEEITKGVQLIKDDYNRPTSFQTLYAGLEKATKNELEFSFKNIGTQPIEADTYNFTTQLVDENGAPVEGITYKTCIVDGEEETIYEDNVIPGPELVVGDEKTLKGYLIIECEDEFNKLAFNVNVNNVENTHFAVLQTGNNITIKPNKGDATLSDLEIGLTNKAITVDYSIRNSSSNGALTVSAITVPENSAFSVNAELPLVIPNNSSATIQVTFATEVAGTYADSITVVHDGIGDTKIPVSGTMLSPTTLLESFEGEVFPPILWEVKQTYFKRNTSEKFHGEACAANTSSSTDTIVTPLLHLAAGDSIAFAIKGYYRSFSSSSYETNILYSSNGRTWTLLKELKGSSDYYTTWKEMAVYMPEDFIEGDYYIGFASKDTYLDMIYGPQVVYQDHRIDIKGFSGKNIGMVNYTQEFTIDIACLGTEGETAESYSIALMNGEENIGNYVVEPMVLGDMKSYTCSWTPRAAGEASIYALLTLNGVVTSTDTITVNVAEETMISTIMIGDLSTKESTPYYKHYLFETLYTPADLEGLNPGAVIESVNIPYYGSADLTGYRINVWIGNTEKAALTTDKMSAADIEGLSHIGQDLRYGTGGSQEEPLYLEMRPETPITYEGGNLSLIISVDSTYYKSGMNFFVKPVSTQSMKTYAIDGDTSSDYMDTWTNGGYIPDLEEKLMVMELGLATEAPKVHGIVTRADNSSPIEGATITLQSGEVIYTGTTDETGAYSIDVLQPNKEYAISVSHDEFTVIEGETVLVETQDIEKNFSMTVITGIDHTAEKAMKIYTHSGNIYIEAGAVIETVKIYSMSGSLCASEAPASESAVINAGGLKGIYVVEVQTPGSVKRAKVRL